MGSSYQWAIALSKPNANLRLVAAQTLFAVCDELHSLDQAIEKHAEHLNQRDLPLYKALCYGSTRWALWYKKLIDQQLKKPFKAKDNILSYLLVTALFELDHMNSADHAVVNETVKATKILKREWAKGVVNAILRNHLRKRDSDTASSKQLEPEQIRQCYPDWLVDQINNDWPDNLDSVLDASMQHPPLTLRINPAKQSRDRYLDALVAADIKATPCAVSPIGITLETPIAVKRIPGFTEGVVSVQDESAQLSVPLLKLAPQMHILDACAAPGGKTGHIFEAEPNLSSVTAVDFSHRLNRLQDNMQRLKFKPNVVALDKQNPYDLSWWDGTLFDRILLDVPCTGTGVMRRHPDIKFRRNHENSLQFAAQQNALLNHCWAILKTGGQLLYTTCSILHLENDLAIATFIAENNNVAVRDLSLSLGLQTPHGRQRLPDVHSGDGFFYSLLEKV